MKHLNASAPILVTGTGRSGTTVVAETLALQPNFLHVEEPNFITDLILPYINGLIDEEMLLGSLDKEGWRGPMKICRTLSGMYPHLFDADGRLPIRPYMRKRFQEILGLGDMSSNSALVSAVLDRIISDTCAAADRTVWLVKQPSAILSWRDLRKFWPGIKIIHVTRRLDYVIQSRLKRGYQYSFVEALSVCEARLGAASEACQSLAPEQYINVRIEDFAARPVSTMDRLFNFLGTSTPDIARRSAKAISRDRLHQLGNPRDFFSRQEMDAIRRRRKNINLLFEEDLV